MKNERNPIVTADTIIFSKREDEQGRLILRLLLTKHGDKYKLPRAVVKPMESMGQAVYRGIVGETGIKLKKAYFVDLYNILDREDNEWVICYSHLAVISDDATPTFPDAIWADVYYDKIDDLDLFTLVIDNKVIVCNFENGEIYSYANCETIWPEQAKMIFDAYRKLQCCVKKRNTIFEFFPNSLEDKIASKALELRDTILREPQIRKRCSLKQQIIGRINRLRLL